MKSEIFPRRLSEMDVFRGEAIGPGHFLYVSPERQDALRQNPYLEDENTICEWVGYADGKPAGFNYCFPIRVWADGKSYRSTTGSCLNVEEWARKTDLGLILPAKGVELTGKDGIAIAAACSQMSIPLHKINGYRYFFMPRYIALWKSRSVVESLMPHWLAWFVAPMANVFLWLYRTVLRVIVACKMLRYRTEEVAADDGKAIQEMAEIVASDARRFREDHDARWFKWHLTCSFSKNGPCKGFVLKEKRTGAVVAFALAKRRFHEKASHRSFRNVWLASVMEWGCVPGREQLLKWFLVSMALRYAGSCDATEFATDDTQLGAFVRKLGWRQVGEANVGIKVMKNFPFWGDSAIKEPASWRIRPAMGDNALS